MSDTLLFTCEGRDHEIALVERPGFETLRQLRAWLPAEATIHSARIAGFHIYWPSPSLAPRRRRPTSTACRPGRSYTTPTGNNWRSSTMSSRPRRWP